MTWGVVGPVVDALESAFYGAFKNVEPAGKRTLLALDVSGSMSGAVLGDGVLTARDASAVMAMVTARTEPEYAFMGFSHQPIELPITAAMTLDQVIRTISGIPFGCTDCGLPMVYANKRGLHVDTFCVYTDNETYVGPAHPHTAMRDYRKRVPGAKLAVVGMTSTGFTIADPADTGMLDVVGFDAAAPAMIADFSSGRLTS
jgi:60 kDa SS-A/Ro ribonucleoprotein